VYVPTLMLEAKAVILNEDLFFVERGFLGRVA
jgi:hypothetical protein